jgi:UDP-N-acetylmuramoylalanine--D-glutamate ligase
MRANLVRELLNDSTRPVAVFGNGISGLAAKDLLDKKGQAYDIFDQKEKCFAPENAGKCSLVVSSPGFSPDHPWIKLAKEKGKIIISELDLGICYSMEKSLVGITGTNGKTSLTTILNHVANQVGYSSMTLGNIGYPLSSAVAEGETSGKVIFLETSSFQATQSTCLSTDSLLWTNFTPDHLDYHKSVKEYFLAKLKLANDCKHASNVWVGESVISSAQRLRIPLNPDFKVVRSLLQQEIPRNLNSCLKSIPQLENLAFALNWFENLGVSRSHFFEALDGYQLEPHRLQKVDCVNQVSFWNDSKSTNLASVLAACRSFSEKIIWIGGGKNKGQEANNFANFLAPFLDRAFLIGEMSFSLNECLARSGIPSISCKSLKDALIQAFQSATQKQNILFSPGFSSFDMFLNYAERGKTFESLVFDLKRSTQESTNLSNNHLQVSY